MATIKILRAAGVIIALLGGFAQGAGARGSPFAESWIDAAHGAEPQMQIQRYDEDTYILRQSIKTNFEGPFIFLFFGTDRFLQIDSGAGGLKIRPTIYRVIADLLRTNGQKPFQLVVAHSHSHHDHLTDDEEFTARTESVVGVQ